MASKNRKVCLSGPTRLTLAEDLLRKADCELVLGKSVDDFRSYRYERRELINLIADSAVLFAAGREFIGPDILDSCPDLQAVVKSSIGIENVDVDTATELGILCCNSPTPENYMGVAEATPILTRFRSPVEASRGEKRWLDGLYLDVPEEWDDPWRCSKG